MKTYYAIKGATGEYLSTMSFFAAVKFEESKVVVYKCGSDIACAEVDKVYSSFLGESFSYKLSTNRVIIPGDLFVSKLMYAARNFADDLAISKVPGAIKDVSPLERFLSVYAYELMLGNCNVDLFRIRDLVIENIAYGRNESITLCFDGSCVGGDDFLVLVKDILYPITDFSKMDYSAYDGAKYLLYIWGYNSNEYDLSLLTTDDLSGSTEEEIKIKVFKKLGITPKIDSHMVRCKAIVYSGSFYSAVVPKDSSLNDSDCAVSDLLALDLNVNNLYFVPGDAIIDRAVEGFLSEIDDIVNITGVSEKDALECYVFLFVKMSLIFAESNLSDDVCKLATIEYLNKDFSAWHFRFRTFKTEEKTFHFSEADVFDGVRYALRSFI